MFRPKSGVSRGSYGNTAQLGSQIGRWREQLRTIRGPAEEWWRHADEATEAVNEQANSGLRNSTPAQAMDPDNALLQFTQLEHASENLQKSEWHADKVRQQLE